MPTQWGAYRDTATNRAIVGRIYREDYTAADVDTVLDYWAQGLVAGSHDPQWTTLEHLARSMGRYLQQAAGVGRGARSVRAINPLCEPLARSPPTDDGPAEPPEYMPDPDDWMAIR
jgi:hypothetical protein